MTLIGRVEAPIVRVPDLYRLVITAGYHAPPIGRPRYRIDGGIVPIGQQWLWRSRWIPGVPYIRVLIVAARDDAPAIRRTCECIHPVGMTCIERELSSARGFPDMNGLIIARRSDTLTIGEPYQSVHTFGMLAIDRYLFSIGAIPGMNGTISASRGYAPVIRRPRRGIHPAAMPPIDREHCTCR